MKSSVSSSGFTIWTFDLMHPCLVAAMPALLAILTQIIAKLRWEEDSHTPMPKVCTLEERKHILDKCLTIS